MVKRGRVTVASRFGLSWSVNGPINKTMRPHVCVSRKTRPMQKPTAFAVALAFLILASAPPAVAKDFFLTIGGGDEPTANQASLERNVLFLQRLLKEQNLDQSRHDIYFADGHDTGKDLQVKDLGLVPQANQLMAEFFGTEDDLGVYYRDHAVPGVRAATTPKQIRRWFHETSRKMKQGDRLILYVTAHGESSDNDDEPYDTSICLWNSQKISVTQVVRLLDRLPNDISVVAVMVQCHAGGFARFIYNEGNPDKGLSKQMRTGFFATMHDRIAAGCTSDIDEATYVEYSTYFWEALAGHTRAGEPIVVPDYDGDGVVSFDEAHAYTILNADTVDMPIKTSGEFLGIESLFANDTHPELQSNNASYTSVLELATPTQRAVLEGLSKQLDLTGSNRIETARRMSQTRQWRRGRFRRRRFNKPEIRLREEIASDLKQRWPALANVLNPGAVELMTARSNAFVEAIERHPSYDQYRKELNKAAARPDPHKQRVKHERFVRTAECVILAENLRRLGDEEALAQYRTIVAAERGSLHGRAPATTNTAAAQSGHGTVHK